MCKMLSVIIPNFNNSIYLERCVQSVIQQTYPKIEVVVVDDCSTDCSPEKIVELMKKYPTVKGIFLKENSGVSKARNIGFINSNGDYVTFLDSDDYYYNKNKIENELKIIETHTNENVIAYSYVQNVDINEKNVGEPNTNCLEGDVFFGWMKGRQRISYARDYCLKREIFIESGMYEEGDSFYEDLDLLFRLSLKHKFYCTHRVGTAYRLKSTGLSKRPISEHKKKTKQIRNRYLKNVSFFKKCYLKLFWFLLDLYYKSKECLMIVKGVS